MLSHSYSNALDGREFSTFLTTLKNKIPFPWHKTPLIAVQIPQQQFE